MREICDRLLVSLEKSLMSDIVRSIDPPQDKSKFWFSIADSELLQWNPLSNSWETAQVQDPACLAGIVGNFLKKDEAGCLYAILSASEENLLELDEEGNILLRKTAKVERFDTTINSDGSGNVTTTVTLTKFSDNAAAVNVMPRADLGASARWWIHAQTSSTITVKFAGLANSTSYDVSIIAHQTEVTP